MTLLQKRPDKTYLNYTSSIGGFFWLFGNRRY
jgi:hypothetical protein